MLLPILLVIDPISWLFGEPPNFAQAGNGSVLSVVSRADGRGAKAGALIDLYYPQYATDQLWDSYVGVNAGGHFAWAQDLRRVGQRLVPDTGLIESTFAGPGYSLVVGDLVRPGSDVHIRHVTLANTGATPLESLSATLYAHFMLGGNPAGDTLRFDRAAGALVQVDGTTAAVVMADRPATAWQCGLAYLPLGPSQDARLAAEAGYLAGNDAAGPFPTGVTGAFSSALPPLAPGASASITFALALAPAASQAVAIAGTAVNARWDALVAEDRDRWGTWLGRAKLPPDLPDDVRAVSRRALITIAQQQTAGGGIMAAPTAISPPYRFVWPRDSSFVAMSLLDTGYAAEAARVFEFLERVQGPDGGWAIDYIPDGSAPFWDIEAANLALGSAWFQVFDDDDPRMRAMADAIAEELASPWGGIRRYTGDTYYGDQPWPITTGWLALYRLATGDRPAALRLLDVMTRYAQQTDTLVLGEQFDEAHNRWTSAFPLSWSEATYLSLAMRLY